MAEPWLGALSSGHSHRYQLAGGERERKRENDASDNLSQGFQRAPISHGRSSKGRADEAEETLACTAAVGHADRRCGRMEELVAGPWDGVFQVKVNAPGLRLAAEG